MNGPHYPDRVYLALTGPELDEISPAFLIDSDLKRSRWADIPTVEYVAASKVREWLCSDRAVEAIVAALPPEGSALRLTHLNAIVLALAAAFPIDTAGREEGSDG